jgi:NAD kinase
MMIIALFYNTGKEAAAKAASSIVLSLKNKGITVISDDNEASLIGAAPISSIQHQKVDFILSLGGDGTILLTATNRLTARLAGTGTIVYGGNPAHVDQRVTGTGTITPG